MIAHVHGGSRREWSNFVIAAALIALALVLHYGNGGSRRTPAALQATLLGVVGLLHLQLARASWQSAETRPVLLAMGGGALLTQNMLVVLAAGSMLAALRRYCPAETAGLWRRRRTIERTRRWQPKGNIP